MIITRLVGTANLSVFVVHLYKWTEFSIVMNMNKICKLFMEDADGWKFMAVVYGILGTEAVGTIS